MFLWIACILCIIKRMLHFNTIGVFDVLNNHIFKFNHILKSYIWCFCTFIIFLYIKYLSNLPLEMCYVYSVVHLQWTYLPYIVVQNHNADTSGRVLSKAYRRDPTASDIHHKRSNDSGLQCLLWENNLF